MGAEKTFGGQSTFIIPVQGLKDAYIIMFDIWKPDKASEGGYIWLPLIFNNNRLSAKWMDEWSMSFLCGPLNNLNSSFIMKQKMLNDAWLLKELIFFFY